MMFMELMQTHANQVAVSADYQQESFPFTMGHIMFLFLAAEQQGVWKPIK
jgi:hypothetical protein